MRDYADNFGQIFTFKGKSLEHFSNYVDPVGGGEVRTPDPRMHFSCQRVEQPDTRQATSLEMPGMDVPCLRV